MITNAQNENKQIIVQLTNFSVKKLLIFERILQRNLKFFNIRKLNANVLIYNDYFAYFLKFDNVNFSEIQLFINFSLAKYATTH